MQPASTPTTAAVRSRHRTTAGPTRVFWTAFAVLMTLSSAWALASPIATGPDENAHLAKAAAVVRGELSGTVLPESPGSATVTVPGLYAFLMGYPVCLAFDGEQSAACLPALPTGDAAEQDQQASTWVVRNNPLYYAVVGLPTLVATGEGTVYTMRLVSAAMCSLLLAWAFRMLAELRRRSMVLVGAIAAITPMVVYLNSIVNPSALEISAGFALWTSLLVLLRAPDPSRLHQRMAGITVVTALLANSRGLSPLYLGLIVLVVAAVGPWSSVLAVLRDRRSWAWIAACGAVTAVSLAWTLRAGTLDAGGATHDELSFLSTANRTVLDTGDFLTAAVGRFGWNDTTLPTLAYIMLFAVCGLPVLLAAALGDRRGQVVTALVVGVAFVVPVVLHGWQARNVGYIWTARYSMPLYVGVLLVAGMVCRTAWERFPRWTERRLVTLVSVLCAGGMLVAFVTNLRRYTVGTEGSWGAMLPGEWSPVVPGAVLIAVAAASLVVAVVAVRRWRDDDVEPVAVATTAATAAEPVAVPAGPADQSDTREAGNPDIR